MESAWKCLAWENRQVNELLNRQLLKAQRGFGSMNCRNISRINVDSATASCSSFSVKGSAATVSTGLGVLGELREVDTKLREVPGI